MSVNEADEASLLCGLVLTSFCVTPNTIQIVQLTVTAAVAVDDCVPAEIVLDALGYVWFDSFVVNSAAVIVDADSALVSD
ncbi:hypothetical protein DPMN_067835 [Dreissena polymorpha]|uniref:Uncharacterized protein n=1 Tax=Dreissena polymorpha TaxID=45954 RepID=A0A9D3YZY3_DREPO|nr:hypothetical protein DPMN_067835 [Dreissena polymorpha]